MSYCLLALYLTYTLIRLISRMLSMSVSITADTSVAFVRESYLTRFILYSRARISFHFTNILKVNIFIFNFVIIIFLTIIITKPLGPVPGKMVKFNSGLTQTSTKFSRVRTSNSGLQNTVEPLPRDTVMITQNVTQSNE